MSDRRNIRETTYKVETKDNVYRERIVKNKTTGKVESHTMTDKAGKNVTPKKKEAPQKKIDNSIEVTKENAPFLQVRFLNELNKKINAQLVLLESIRNQMVEMNFYMAHLEPEDSRSQKKIYEHFDKLGIKLQGLHKNG